jgi:hypothetical protein
MTDPQDRSQPAEPVATPVPTPAPAPSEPLLRGGATLEPGTVLPIIDMTDRHEMSAPRPDNILKGITAPQPGLRAVVDPPATPPQPPVIEAPVEPRAE